MLHRLRRIFSKKFIRELFPVVLGQSISVLGSIVGVKLLTNKLAPADFGELSLALSLSIFTQQLLFGPLSGPLLRFYSIVSEKNDLPRYFRDSYQLSVKIIVILFIVGLVLSVGFVFLGYREISSLIFFSALYSIFLGINTLFDSVQSAARQRIVVAWHQGIGQK